MSDPIGKPVLYGAAFFAGRGPTAVEATKLLIGENDAAVQTDGEDLGERPVTPYMPPFKGNGPGQR